MEDLLQRGFNESLNQFERTISMDNLSCLKELNLLEQVKYVCAMDGLINVVFEDYADLLEGRSIVSYVNEKINSKDKLTVNNVQDVVASHGIVYISCNVDCKLSDLMDVLDKVFDEYPEIDLIYGAAYNEDLKENELKVFGLFVA